MRYGVRILIVAGLTLPFAGAEVSGRGFAARGGGAVARGNLGGVAAGGTRTTAAVGPLGGGTVTNRTGGTVIGPGGSAARAGTASGTRVTPGGTTIQYGAAGAGASGPLGGAVGRGVGGVQVTTPGGQTATKVGTAGGAVGPGGVAVGGHKSVGVASGPGGVAVGTSGGRTAIGPAGALHTGYSGGVALGPYGAAAGGSRGVVATGPVGTVAGGSRYGVATGRYGTYHVNSAVLATQGAYVRRGFGYYSCFTPGWYSRYPGAWYTAGWVGGRAWAVAPWVTVASYCGYPAAPIYYDYGSTVVYQDNVVYVNGESTGTPEQYSQQATQLADAGRAAKPPEKDDWQPLGVFALVQGDEQTSYKIFQLAINKDGVIRGNYYDALADNTLAVYGSVDKKTQRAAWSIGEKKDIVYETGIANLTKDETTVLVHLGKDNDQQFTLVRVEKPDEKK